MKSNRIALVAATVILASTLPGCGLLMMGAMGGAHGRDDHGGATRSTATGERLAAALGAETRWIELALAHARELDLTADQERSLTAIRDAWMENAGRLRTEVQAAEAELRRLFDRRVVDLGAVRVRIKLVAALEGDLRFGRVEAIEKATAVLTPVQRDALAAIARSRGAIPRGHPSTGHATDHR